MKTILSRLTYLEGLVDHRQAGTVTVCLTDGTRRRMPLPDVIPLIHEGRVLTVDGTGGPGQGRLPEIIQGLLTEVKS